MCDSILEKSPFKNCDTCKFMTPSKFYLNHSNAFGLPASLLPTPSLSFCYILMGSQGFQCMQTGFYPTPLCRNPYFGSSPRPPRIRLTITCGLRNSTRKLMWRSRVLSTEAIQAVHSLKLAKSASKLEEVFSSRICRLVKADLLDTLAELQRQNEVDLALKVFQFVRKEVWYEPNQSLFSDMMLIYGMNKMIDMVEELFSAMKKEGLEPGTRSYNELLGAYLQVSKTEEAMETYGLMKTSGCIPDKLTLTILLRYLYTSGEEELSRMVEKDCDIYLDAPNMFLRELQKKYRKKKSVAGV